MSRKTHLKIKIKTLAAETAIIRHEEAKSLANPVYRKMDKNPATGKWEYMVTTDGTGYNQAYTDLHNHRIGIVRSAARENLLAYAYIRGRGYPQTERVTKSDPNFAEVKKIAVRFYEGTWDEAKWTRWLDEARAHIQTQADARKKAA